MVRNPESTDSSERSEATAGLAAAGGTQRIEMAPAVALSGPSEAALRGGAARPLALAADAPALLPRAWGVWLASQVGQLTTATVFLLLLAVAELLTAFGDPLYGVGLHIALLGLVLMASVADTEPRRHAFYLVLAFGPLIRIVSTGMPLRVFPQELWYLLTSLPLFATAYVIVRLLNLSPRSIGLRLPERRYLLLEPLVVASGLILGVMEWLILRPSLLVNGASAAGIIGGTLILLVGTGLMEELLFRGLIQYAACRLFGMAPGIFFSATIFAVLHIGHRSAIDVVFVGLVGLYFSVIVRYTRSLIGVTLAHGTINTMLFIVLPLLVKG